MKIAYLLLSTLLLSYFTNAQESTAQTTTIKDQFNETIDEAGNYQDYKVVKLVKLNELKSATVKRINGLNDTITQLQTTISDLETNIKNLTDQLNSTQTKVDELKDAKDSVSLLGISVDKFTYNLILWSIIAALLLFMIIFIFKYKNANDVTRGAQTNLKLVEDELEAYKRRSMEKEQQLSRQLMDERKKNTGK